MATDEQLAEEEVRVLPLDVCDRLRTHLLRGGPIKFACDDLDEVV